MHRGGNSPGCKKTSEVEVKELAPEDYGTWDELARESSQGSIFHKSFWLAFSANALKRELKIYGCFEGGNLIGGCSVYVRKMGSLRVADSILPMTPYGGVVLARPRSDNVRKQEEACANIIRQLDKAFGAAGYDYICITNSPEFIDIRPFTWNGWRSSVSYAYYLDVQEFSDETVSKEVRWSARKAIEKGVTVKKLDIPDASSFYRLLLVTYRRQSLEPPVSADFLENALKTLMSEHACEMWTAETPSGDLASAEIIVRDAKRAYRLSAASDSRLRQTGATSLLLCEILRDLKVRGFKEINLMAANTPRLAKFVAAFNPRLLPYYSVERKNLIARVAESVYRATKRK
jgi:hypothetical protein